VFTSSSKDVDVLAYTHIGSGFRPMIQVPKPPAPYTDSRNLAPISINVKMLNARNNDHTVQNDCADIVQMTEESESGISK